MREEAGIEVELKGILKIDHVVSKQFARVIFYAEPSTLEMSQKLRSMATEESVQAKWVTTDEITKLRLRNSEPLDWA